MKGKRDLKATDSHSWFSLYEEIKGSGDNWSGLVYAKRLKIQSEKCITIKLSDVSTVTALELHVAGIDYLRLNTLLQRSLHWHVNSDTNVASRCNKDMPVRGRYWLSQPLVSCLTTSTSVIFPGSLFFRIWQWIDGFWWHAVIKGK